MMKRIGHLVVVIFGVFFKGFLLACGALAAIAVFGWPV